jgi:hypothetical protein
MLLLPLMLLATMSGSSAIMNVSNLAANRRGLSTSCRIVTNMGEAECDYPGCNGYQYWGCGGGSTCVYGYTDSACQGKANLHRPSGGGWCWGGQRHNNCLPKNSAAAQSNAVPKPSPSPPSPPPPPPSLAITSAACPITRSFCTSSSHLADNCNCGDCGYPACGDCDCDAYGDDSCCCSVMGGCVLGGGGYVTTTPPPPLPAAQSNAVPIGISIGAIALILFIGVSGCIVARRTAPVRAVWARKRALREPLVACGLTRHLQQAGVCDDEQVLERAAAWVRANKPGSVEDIIRFGLAQSFVNSLNLPPIPQQKLLATFGGHPQHEMSVEMQQAMPVSMPIATEAVAMGTAVGMGTGVGMKTELGGGGSWFSGSAGGSSSSNQPTLSEAVAILKRELGLEGNVADVVKQAAFQLGVDGSLPLVEMARQCVQNLGVVGECA